MKVYIEPSTNLSRAMTRVEKALTRHAPDGCEIVTDQNAADLVILHVIGFDVEQTVKTLRAGQRYAMIQHCLRSTQRPSTRDWLPLWRNASLVWSHYNLDASCREEGTSLDGVNFYLAPLGLDEAFLSPPGYRPRDIGVMTSGYVAGPKAEAIEEVAIAAGIVGLPVLHIGPPPEGMATPGRHWSLLYNISDAQLAGFYRRSWWVSGLRHVEGFELPALEGLACGARPILFDRADMRQWYTGHCVLVPECSGQRLVDLLVELLSAVPPTVPPAERVEVLAQFNWERIAQGFWAALRQPVSA